MSIQKYKDNPILTKDSVPFTVNSIFNPGAIKFNNEILLVCRVEMPSGRSSFVMARSKDGIKFKVDEKSFLTPEDHGEYYEFVKWGIEDARINKVDEKYYLTYTGYSKYTPLVILAETNDFLNFKIHGPITEPSNKDAAIFPEKINGFYWKMDRPTGEEKYDIWINKSPDLIHWGSYKALAEKRAGTWEANKIGGSTPPIKTDNGWLFLYHGVRKFSNSLYKIGAMLLDLEKPWIEIGRTTGPILQPEFVYERVGDVNNTVFTNGWIVEDTGEVTIYYSGSDSNICIATTTVDYLISLCK
ncbi:glycosidase [Bacteroidota bacterium]